MSVTKYLIKAKVLSQNCKAAGIEQLSFQAPKDRDRGGGWAGRAAAPPLFCAPAPTFALKRKIIKIISVSSLMPTYKEQEILEKECKVTRQKQIKYYDFIPFFRFSI